MNKTQQLLKEREEKLRDQVRGLIADTITYYNRYDVNFEEWDWREPIENDIKSFHATTISLLLNSLKEEVSQLKDSLQGLGMSQEAGEILEAFFESFLSETISNIQTK